MKATMGFDRVVAHFSRLNVPREVCLCQFSSLCWFSVVRDIMCVKILMSFVAK